MSTRMNCYVCRTRSYYRYDDPPRGYLFTCNDPTCDGFIDCEARDHYRYTYSPRGFNAQHDPITQADAP